MVLCRDRKMPSPFNHAMISVAPSSVQKFSVEFRSKNAKETCFPVEGYQRYPRISTPSTPRQKEFSATPPPHPRPPSSYCWRYSRWSCHSRPCVPSGILSYPQPAVPRSLQLLTIYLHTHPRSLTKHCTTRIDITGLCHVKNHTTAHGSLQAHVGL